MKATTLILGLVLSVLCHAAVASDPSRGSIVFGAQIGSACDRPEFGSNETVELVAWASKFAIQAVVGLAASAVDAGTKASTKVHHAKARGLLYTWSDENGTWTPVTTLCVRFWQAKVGEKAESALQADYGVDESLTSRWRSMAFLEAPYAYGEVLLTIDAKNNVLGLDPVLLYGRRSPESQGFWRKAGALSVAIDLSSLGSDTPFAAHVVDLPDFNDRPVLLRNASSQGLGSGWHAMPAAPSAPPKFAEGEPKVAGAGHFTARVTLSSASSASLIGEALATTLKDQKDGLVDAITPKTRAERELLQDTAIRAAFDAVAAVLEADEALAANTDTAKTAKLRLAQQKAQYLADIKLQAAGLPARYGVTAP